MGRVDDGWERQLNPTLIVREHTRVTESGIGVSYGG